MRDLTVVADKARLAQKGLYEVDGLLHTIARALADSHPPESQSGPHTYLAEILQQGDLLLHTMARIIGAFMAERSSHMRCA